MKLLLQIKKKKKKQKKKKKKKIYFQSRVIVEYFLLIRDLDVHARFNPMDRPLCRLLRQTSDTGQGSRIVTLKQNEVINTKPRLTLFPIKEIKKCILEYE